MKKRIFLKIFIGLFSLVLISVGVLAWHIHAVMKKNTAENVNQIQLSRIDFKEPVDSAEALKIKNFVNGLDGVQGAFFNVPNGIFIYTYRMNKQNSLSVYQKVMNLGHYKAERVVLTADQAKAAAGCPMKMNDHSFTSHLSLYISKLFN